MVRITLPVGWNDFPKTMTLIMEALNPNGYALNSHLHVGCHLTVVVYTGPRRGSVGLVCDLTAS